MRHWTGLIPDGIPECVIKQKDSRKYGQAGTMTREGSGMLLPRQVFRQAALLISPGHPNNTHLLYSAYEALRCQMYRSADNSPSIPAAPFKASPFVLIASCLNANCMITYSPSVKSSCRQTKNHLENNRKDSLRRNLRWDVAELIKLNLFPYVTSIEAYFSTLDKYKNQRVCRYVIRQKAQNRLLIHFP